MSKLEAGKLIIEAFKAALDTIDNFVGNDGPAYERAKRGLDVAEEFFRTEQPQPAEDPVMNAIVYSIQAQERDEAIKPQPQKTRVRLWMRNDIWERPSVFVSDRNPYPGSSKYIEIHCDAEGFYVEKRS